MRSESELDKSQDEVSYILEQSDDEESKCSAYDEAYRKQPPQIRMPISVIVDDEDRSPFEKVHMQGKLVDRKKTHLGTENV